MGYIEALEAAGATVLLFEVFGSYQGDWWAKVDWKGQQSWVHGYYGSCSVCDAFDGEFGHNKPRCREHRYGPEQSECSDCKIASLKHNEWLVRFGLGYLEKAMMQDQAEKEASEDISWDLDTEAMLAFLQENQIE